MVSCKYVPIIFVLITPSYFGWAQDIMLGEVAALQKFTPREHAEKFFQKSLTLEGYGTNWIVMPDGNGTNRVALMQMPKRTMIKMYSFEEAYELMNFRYFKTAQDDVWFTLKDVKKINFDSKKPTKIICHGWMADSRSSVITDIKDAYLAEKNVNVIGVDWSSIALDYFYPNPAGSTATVGEVVAKLIDDLVKERNATYGDFHIIGHSLGAHIAGHAGKFTQKKIRRITGLDPALPGFQYTADSNGRLNASDAEFVDIIHTCSGVLGISIPVGHVDFYPNGGSVFQPGCSLYSVLEAPEACSHSRSHQLFAESIRKTSDFKAVKCNGWEEFVENNCGNVFTVMGEHIPLDTSPGEYYLRTREKFPYSQGLNGIRS